MNGESNIRNSAISNASQPFGVLSRTLNHFRNEIISVRNIQRRALTVEAPYISTQLAGVTRLRCLEKEAVLTSQASSIEMNFRCISHLAMRTQFALPELPLLKHSWVRLPTYRGHSSSAVLGLVPAAAMAPGARWDPLGAMPSPRLPRL